MQPEELGLIVKSKAFNLREKDVDAATFEIDRQNPWPHVGSHRPSL